MVVVLDPRISMQGRGKRRQVSAAGAREGGACSPLGQTSWADPFFILTKAAGVRMAQGVISNPQRPRLSEWV